VAVHVEISFLNVYLAAISGVGVGFLACVMLSWTAHASIDVYRLNGACQTLTYVTHVTSFLGVWYVIAFTVERYIAVHYPLRRMSLCTPAKARRAVVALALFAGVVYSYSAWMSDVTEPWPDAGRICAPLRRYAAVMTAVHVVDTAMTLLLPFLLITLLNVRIAVTVFRHNRARQAMAARVPQRPPCRDCPPPAVDVDRDRRILHRFVGGALVGCRRSVAHDQFRVTKLLLAVSVVFLVLNLPRHAARAYTLRAMPSNQSVSLSLSLSLSVRPSVHPSDCEQDK